MEREKESMADICARLQPHKKVTNWASIVPMTVTVRDDVSRGRFSLTQYEGTLLWGKKYKLD